MTPTRGGERVWLAMIVAAPLLVASDGCGKGDTGPHARTCAIAAPQPSDWRLRADGTRFRDALGRVVFLRGVNAGGRSKFAPFAPFDYTDPTYGAALAAYLDRAASWGVDVLRVPFTWAAVEPAQGADDEAFLKRYDALVDAAWARGIWTVVDMHQDIYAEVFCGDGFPAWTVPDPKPAPHHDCPNWKFSYFSDAGVSAAFDRFWADGSTVQAAYAAMWDRMAARHKDRPGVIGFELINEPGWGTKDIGVFEGTVLSPFFSKMIARVRGTAPATLLFVEPTGFASIPVSTSMTRPAGDGIVFAPHYYQVAADTNGAHPDQVIDGLGKWAKVGTDWNVPVFVGEFGVASTTDAPDAFMQVHFDALDALGLSGTEWEYSVAKDAWNAEVDGIVAADGTELGVAKAVVRPFARAVAGDGITSSFDAASRTFALEFAPTAGVTEVSLPTRAYPSGFAVDLTGACVDSSQPGRLFIQPDTGATRVSLHVTSR